MYNYQVSAKAKKVLRDLAYEWAIEFRKNSQTLNAPNKFCHMMDKIGIIFCSNIHTKIFIPQIFIEGRQIPIQDSTRSLQ